MLTEQAGAWFYKRNLSPIERARRRIRADRTRRQPDPTSALAGGQAQFMDLAGDGQPDLVVLDGPTPGFYEHDDDEGWGPFRPFASRLNRDTRDPNLRFVDLDGDGHADVLITEDDAFVWHPSLAEEGFGPARRVQQALDEEAGPRLVFADASAVDLSGRHERRRSDRPGAHPQRRGLLLAQPRLRPLRRQGHDGPRAALRPAGPASTSAASGWRTSTAPAPPTSSTSHGDGVRLYFNQSGNGWSAGATPGGIPRRGQPRRDPGRGPARQRHRLPGLVVAAAGRCDAADALRRSDGRAEAAPAGSARSTTSAPRPSFTTRRPPSSTWPTSSPANPGSPSCRFRCTWSSGSRPSTASAATASSPATPTTTATSTASSASSAASAWSSSGTPRSSRRSARARSSRPATNIDASSHVPPVLTTTWFHTGVYLGREQRLELLRRAAGRRRQRRVLPRARLTDAEAERTAARRHGAARRADAGRRTRSLPRAQGRDAAPGGLRAGRQRARSRIPTPSPSRTSRSASCSRKAGNRHAVFFTHAREAITTTTSATRRSAHRACADAGGGRLRQCPQVRRRRLRPPAGRTPRYRAQTRRSKPSATSPAPRTRSPTRSISTDAYRTPLPCESRTYELTGLDSTRRTTRLGFDQLLGAVATAARARLRGNLHREPGRRSA